MWTLCETTNSEWTPRSVVKAVIAKVEEVVEKAVPPSVMRVILDALRPFTEARSAVGEALARVLPP